MEILVASMVLVLLMGTLTYTFVLGKGYIMHSRNRMTAGELTRYFLEPLQMEVRNDTWDDDVLNRLTVNSYHDSLKVDIVDYNADYNITNFTGLRKVILNLTWEDVSF